MEQFVKMLYDRLEKKKYLQMQLYVIMQNAINEMHNNGIIAGLTGEVAQLMHDPDLEVRVREKTSLAKSVGKQFIPTTMPVPSQGGFPIWQMLIMIPDLSIQLLFVSRVELKACILHLQAILM